MKRMILVWLAILFCSVAFLAFLAYKRIPASKESWKHAIVEEANWGGGKLNELSDRFGVCQG